MTDWLWILTGTAAGLTALGVVWRKAIRPAARVIYLAGESFPVLLDIAKEFKPNQGLSLVDRIGTIEDDMTTCVLRLDEMSSQLEVLITRK